MDKRQLILDAATKLFANEGVAVPTSRLAKAAGVSNGTLFNYFETKQALIDELYYSTKANVLDGLLEKSDLKSLSAIEMMSTIWHHYLQWALENPEHFKVIDMFTSAELVSEEARESTDKLFEFITEALEQGQCRGELRNAPIDLICELGQSQLKALVSYTHKHNLSDENINSIVETAFSLYWLGISSNPNQN